MGALAARDMLPLVLVLTAAVLLALLSQLLRPSLGLSLFWPVDALLAGVLLRHRPARQAMPLWGAVLALGFFLMHMGCADPWRPALGFALADLAGVAGCWYLLTQRWPLESLRRPQAILQIVVAGALAAALHTASTVVLEQGLDVVHSFQLPPLSRFFGRWLGYVTLLPVVLLAPALLPSADRRQDSQRSLEFLRSGTLLMPAMALAASLVLCFALGGPGAVAFPIPALMYCAYVYQQQASAWLAFLTASIVMLGSESGWFLADGGVGLHHAWGLVSLQIGTLLMVATPLLMSSTLAARNDLIAALNQALDHDELTEAMSRQAFLRGAQEYMQQRPAPVHGNAFLMLDVDHFKQLNDAHGHAAGDIVLREFSKAVRAGIRPRDLFGRLGGEEFGIALPNTPLHEALDVAERLRAGVETIALYYDSDEPLRITVSIGAIHDGQLPHAPLDRLLMHADEAMYEAKRGGRNRVRAWIPPT